MIRVGPVKFGLSRPARNTVQKASKKGGKVSNAPGKGGLGMGPKSDKEKFQPGRPGNVAPVTGQLATWWRVVYITKDNDYFSGLNELDFGGNGGVSATAFSHSDLGTTPDGAAFDGNISTAWRSNFTSEKAFIGCQFPEPVSCEYITVSASIAGYFAAAFDVEFSHDGINWEVYWAWTNVSPLMAAGEVRTFNSANAAQGLFVSNISGAVFVKHPPGGSVSNISGAVFVKHPPGGSVSNISGAVFVKRLANRSWRVQIDATYTGAYVAVAEIQMRSTIGGADECNGGLAGSSTFFGAGNEPDLAFDGDTNTRWASGNGAAFPQWIEYKFGADHPTFAEIAIIAHPSNVTTAIKSFRVQRWDGLAWLTELTVVDGAAWTNGETRTYAIV
tara:strand:+ start:4075 stop:5238 length:1164 start_codon:yes stop_codon:yes gene_type:complete